MAIIDKPSTYFQTTLYTGNASNNHAITNSGQSNLAPNWVWIKNISTGSNRLFDSVRGVNKIFTSDNTSASDGNYSSTLTAFGSNGFTLANDSDGFNVNLNSNSYASWNWAAGTSFSNNAGANGASLASTGSVNTTAGFSIVSWTSPNSNANTIAHGLGSVPEMIIMKKRGAAGGWVVYHQAMGNTHGMFLSTANAKEDNAGFFNDTSPTSAVFTTGSDGGLINNTMIAYCFAGKQSYSKFGLYIGNGNADGPFVYLGFKPAFVLVKLESGADDWQILDNKRNPINIMNKYLRPNDNGATVTNAVVDFLSNGFKLRSSAGSWNPNGGSFIFMAFAENPFVTSTGNNSIPSPAK